MKAKKASGSKKSAAQPPAKKKGSKASKHSEGETIEDDVVVDMDADEEEGGSLELTHVEKLPVALGSHERRMGLLDLTHAEKCACCTRLL